MISFFSIGLVLSSVILGLLSDKLKARRNIMLFGLLGLIGASLLMALLYQKLWALMLGRFLQGVSSGSVWVRYIILDLSLIIHVGRWIGIIGRYGRRDENSRSRNSNGNGI